jgi:peptidoglycan/LPS O-acetylase OafA/YrhL
MPAYGVALAAILLLATGSALSHWWQVPVHALLIHGLVPDELESFYLVAWSLVVEAIFYALVPLGAWVVLRRTRGRAVPLDRLIAGVLGLWGVAVAVSVSLALAFPLEPGRTLPGGVQVLGLAGSLANFCPGMLVFLAVTAGADPNSRWPRRYAAVASRPLPTLTVAALMLLAATQLPFQTSHLATAAQGPLFGIASGLILATFVQGHEFTIVSGTGLTATGVRVVSASVAHASRRDAELAPDRAPAPPPDRGLGAADDAREAAKPRALAGRAQASLPASTRP